MYIERIFLLLFLDEEKNSGKIKMKNSENFQKNLFLFPNFIRD